MPSFIKQIIFSEPSGRPNSLVQFTASFVFLGIYLYYWAGGHGNSVSWILVMMIGSALSGIAESLPKDQQRAAGILRGTAVTVFLCLLAATVFAPEFIVG
ncbi:hypothetical protein ACFQJ5_19460 [Halomicroarcula sp. GCM10025324]|uniref:hypothetical protein n=1 Tax=Halomicroarcula sp. GCM10025324 TaxID=3252667 RepID=UPI0036121C53